MAKLPLSWASPHRLLRRQLRSARSKLRSRQSPTGTSIATLNTSLNPADTLRALRTHHWSYHDAQYIILAIVAIFSITVTPVPGPITKTLIATLLMTGLTIPLTRQFLLPALPVLGWAIFFPACAFVPSHLRPGIWVKLLPAMENILYGANLSNILSAHKSTPLNILAWLPYGIMHYGSPVVVCIFMFLFGPPGMLPIWAKSFGYMCITGVAIQLFFPCSPPWYENMYGLAPANYSIHGEAAGLAAIDRLFGVDMYTSKFAASPVVFGAFPSLHSGWATLEMLFMGYVFPRGRPLFLFYLGWLWWTTMYLSHHYAVDLVAGSLISGVCYFYARDKFMPRVQQGKMFRWDYDYVEFGEAAETSSDSYDLDDFYQPPGSGGPDSDEWTLGSSSSMSGGSREPSVGGLRSPLQESWEGDTLASGSDHEDGVGRYKI
ncbi:Phosphatidylinositol:ceramide phosphoinositol transferase (IPC synthase) [Elasticomyces elasticus]|uniref:Phosphatidylinositol:ceramide phosphoinositol transferase (IPC synthase) n=1 Tax=Elasticomyces elasticus TaxID=574655 RepID=A0AAN8A4I0_9PEZI|nr:Phosphatidylinositol:ceramide phosphoinositol transferase (IPC synthase) [Elasticomyces elasticus]